MNELVLYEFQCFVLVDCIITKVLQNELSKNKFIKIII